MLRCAGKVLQRTFVVFALTFVVATLGGRSALSARPDALTSSTLGGPDLVTQSLFIRDHVPAPMSSQERLFRHRNAVSKEVAPLSDTSSVFAWEAGYAFSWPKATSANSATAVTGSMITHSGHVGMSYDVNPNWQVSAEVEGDVIPDQSYGHGHIEFRIERFFPLFATPQVQVPQRVGNGDKSDGLKEPLDPSKLSATASSGSNSAPVIKLDEERDARSYYFKHRKRRLEVREDSRYRGRYRKKELSVDPVAVGRGNPGPLVETGPRPSDSPYPHYDDEEEPPPAPAPKLPPEPLDPHLTFALLVGADQHVRDLGTNLSLTEPLTSGEELSGLSVGGEVVYHLHAGLSFYVSGVFSSYSSKISTFLSSLPTATALSFIMPKSVIGALQPHFLAFPGFQFEEGGAYEINPRWRLELALNQVIYASTGAGLGLGFSPAATYTITKDWNAGLGMGICAGGPASGTVLGLLNVGYLF